VQSAKRTSSQCSLSRLTPIARNWQWHWRSRVLKCGPLGLLLLQTDHGSDFGPWQGQDDEKQYFQRQEKEILGDAPEQNAIEGVPEGGSNGSVAEDPVVVDYGVQVGGADAIVEVRCEVCDDVLRVGLEVGQRKVACKIHIVGKYQLERV